MNTTIGDRLLGAIYDRRVTRGFTNQCVPEEILWKILTAARWAPTANNIRVHRFICVNNPELIEQILWVTPGIDECPPALVAICVDWALVPEGTLGTDKRAQFIDVGTAAQNMLIAAHSLGVGAGPVTSFSAAGVSRILNLPSTYTPELFVCLGYAASDTRMVAVLPKVPTRVEDLVHWGGFE